MKYRILLLICSFVVLSCESNKPYDREPIQKVSHGVMYRRGDGLELIQCQGGPPPKMCGSVEITAEQIYSDCSDEKYECLFNQADVFAVPHGGVVTGQAYEAFGAKLEVKHCFGDQGECRIAVISSRCSDASTCSCRSDVSGKITTFYYSKDLGITSFYSIGDVPPPGISEESLIDVVPLLTYVLTAEKGFLRTPLELQKAISKVNCDE